MGRRSRKSKRRMNSLFMALLLTAVMLIMSTYAWFSANRTVSIEGITAKVSAAEGLQISLDGVSWGASVTVDAEKLAGVASYNTYVYPNELHPVSTTGATSSNEIQFYDGIVSSDGTELSSAASATRTTTTNAASGKYIMFDVYLKNSSSRDKDDLLLGANSSVALGAAENKKGQPNSGLENSVRIGFALHPDTAIFTASQSEIVALSGKPLVSVWEPNYNAHIPEVVALDSRVEKSATSDFATLGLLQAGSGTITGINGTTNNTYMSNFTTVRTAAVAPETPLTAVDGTVTVTPGTGEGVPSTTAMTGGTQLTLTGNAISKLTIYIWLEGQDPDCIDTASTGKYLDFAINLSKPSTT